MKSLNDWAYGRFDIKKPALELNLKEIAVDIKEGESLKGNLIISTGTDVVINGYLSCDSPFIKFTQNSFNDIRVTLEYTISTTGLFSGDENNGIIRFFTNLGIMNIPFNLKVLPPSLTVGNLTVNNFEEFVSLAAENYNTATDFFFNDGFERIVLGNDSAKKAVYKQIMLSKYKKDAVDKFLCTCGLKKNQFIRFADTNTNRVFAPKDVTSYSFGLRIENKGHTDICVSCNCSFIELDTDIIEVGDNDASDIVNFRYKIKPEKLREGINEGFIHLDNDLQRITYRVLADNSVLTEIEKKKLSKKRNLIIILMNEYIDFRLGKLKKEEWAVKSLEYIEVLEKLDSGVFIKLYKVHLLLGINNIEKARLLLYSIDIDNEADITNKAYFLYLVAFFKDEENFADELKSDIVKFRNDRPELFSLLWFLLFLNDEYVNDVHKRFKVLKEQYEFSKDNVLLLCEAAVMLNKNPELLSEFSDFEIQVCHFALKRNMISGGLWNAIFHTATFARSFRVGVYRLLTAGYDRYLTFDRLEVICGYCITGGCIGDSFLPIYEQAIMQGTAITGVYEYYLKSLPTYLKKPVIKQALHYFKYKTDISDEDRAILYVNIQKYYNNDEIFSEYAETIKNFTLEMLSKRQVNTNLIYLYNNVLKVDDINAKNVDAAAFISLLSIVKIKRDDAVCVTVADSRFKRHISVNLDELTAIVPITSNDVSIAFELKDGRVYFDKEFITVTKILNRPDLLNACSNYNVNCFEYQVYKNDYINLAASDNLADDFNILCNNEAVRYFAENPYDDRASTYVETANIRYMNLLSKIRISNLYILYNRHSDALRLMSNYGYYGVNIEQLSDFCEAIIRLDNKEELQKILDDSWFVNLCTHLYNKGSRSRKLISFLSLCMQGDIKELVKLWENCGFLKLDKTLLEERILKLSCYLGIYDPATLAVYESYIQNIVNKKIALAYLSLIAFDYYILKSKIDNQKRIFFHIINYFMNFKNLSGVCKMAALDYLSTKPDFTKDENAFILSIIKEHIDRGIYFDIFDEFIHILSDENILIEGVKRQKRYVTHIDDTGKLIFIKYKLLNSNGMPIDSMSDFQRATMQEIYPCIYIKDFIIFASESIRYIIVCFEGESENELYENTVTVKRRKFTEKKRDRYELVEELLLSKGTEMERVLHEKISKLDMINKDMFLIR